MHVYTIETIHIHMCEYEKYVRLYVFSLDVDTYSVFIRSSVLFAFIGLFMHKYMYSVFVCFVNVYISARVLKDHVWTVFRSTVVPILFG